jgi:hypothetical protein
MEKTSTVVECIMHLVLHDVSFEILACNLSNAAADLLVECLAASLSVDQFLRLNARSHDIKSIPEDVREFSAFQSLQNYELTTLCSLPAPLRPSSRR